MTDELEIERYEEENVHGFRDLLECDPASGKPHPVCPTCFAHKPANRGEGMCCYSCQREIIAEMSHDYDEGVVS